ncbi:MAG: universal stress protein [Pelagibacterales bacterium]|nr:universal stress protein [Pelagibacterales bacterium]
MRKDYLVIIDESDELKNAIYFAAKRSVANNANLIMLYVVRPAVNVEWASVGNLIEQEETKKKKKISRLWSRLWSAVVEEKFKIKPQIIIKMGDKVDEIIKFLKEDKSIRFLILASSIDSDPGPIIKSLSKKMNDLPVPLVIIPGLISEKELDNLI